MSADPQEREFLEAMTQSAGWGWLLHWYEQEWGPSAMAQKYERIHQNPAIDKDTKNEQIGQAIVSRNAVRGLLQAPLARIAVLDGEAQKAAQPATRRGVGL